MLGKASNTRRLRTIALAIVCALLSTACVFAVRSQAPLVESGLIFVAVLVATGSIIGLNERLREEKAIARAAKLEAETERRRNSLLHAVSHDLKTPLASMIAAGTTLLARKAQLDTEDSESLLSTIVSEGERLRRLIQNLLSIARLEAPTIELRRTPEAVEDIVSVAVKHFTTRFDATTVVTELADDLPLISVEPLLVEQVLANLLENAVRYAGVSSTIRVNATAELPSVVIRVADDGPGIPEDERDKVFEKFYRGSRAMKSPGGAGLGLTICRAIVQAHGGRIVAREGTAGGAVVEFTLPIAEPRLMTDRTEEEPRAEDEAAE